MKRIILSILATTSIHPEVIKGSLLQVPGRTIDASILKKGDYIISAGKAKMSLALARVTNISKGTVSELYEIDLGDGAIAAAPSQTFYDVKLQKWIKAKDLNQTNQLLGRDMKPRAVVKINKRSGQFETIRVSVDGTNTLINEELVTHNHPALVTGLKVLGWLGMRVVEAVVAKIIGKTVDDFSDGYNQSMNSQSDVPKVILKAHETPKPTKPEPKFTGPVHAL